MPNNIITRPNGSEPLTIKEAYKLVRVGLVGTKELLELIENIPEKAVTRFVKEHIFTRAAKLYEDDKEEAINSILIDLDEIKEDASKAENITIEELKGIGVEILVAYLIKNEIQLLKKTVEDGDDEGYDESEDWYDDDYDYGYYTENLDPDNENLLSPSEVFSCPNSEIIELLDLIYEKDREGLYKEIYLELIKILEDTDGDDTDINYRGYNPNIIILEKIAEYYEKNEDRISSLISFSEERVDHLLTGTDIGITPQSVIQETLEKPKKSTDELDEIM